MANHGAVTTGASLAEAYRNALYLDWMCELVSTARSLGEPRLLEPGELDAVAVRLHAYRRAAS